MSNNSQNQEPTASDLQKKEQTKPKIISSGNKNERDGSKTAPVEQDLNFGNDLEETNNYLSSYNYYIYYNSIKPRDPRLPKPTYKAVPDLDFIKDGRIKEEEEQGYDMPEGADGLNFPAANTMNKNNMNNLNNMMTNLSIGQPQFQSQSQSSLQVQEPSPYDDPSIDLFNPMSLSSQGKGTSNQFNPNMNIGNIGMGNGMGNMNMNPWDEVDNNYQMNQSKPKQQLPKKNMGGNSYSYNNNANPYLDMNFNQPNAFPYFKPGIDPMSFQNQNIYNTYYGQNINGNHQGNYGNLNNYNLNQMFANPQPLNNFKGNNYGYMNPNNMNFQPQMMGMNMNNFNKQNFKGKDYGIGGASNNYHPKNKMIDAPSQEEIISKAVEYAKDHSGSRLVQKKYEESTKEDRDKLFDKLQPEIISLSKDVFGNYAIQKILEFKEAEKNKIILQSLQSKIYDLSVHMYGCRVIQKLIEVIDYELLEVITVELKPHLSKCIENQNGNHVIQKLIERLKPGEHDSIYSVIIENVYAFSIHQYGCRVIQKLFNHCTDEQREELTTEINKNIIDLCRDQFGNYVIQFILKNRKGDNVPEIYAALKSLVFEMSLHKFASNVIEIALTYGSEQQRTELIDEIISKDDQTHDSLLSMVKDKFGNYVVQKMIEFSNQTMKENIIKRIISSQSLKKRDDFSKHVMNFIEKLGFSVDQFKLQK